MTDISSPIPSETPDISTTIHDTIQQSILHTLQSYCSFTQHNPYENAKEFGTYHTACKAALSHLESLLKLKNLCRTQAAQDNADTSKNTTHTNPDLDKLLHHTRKALSKHAP